MPAKGKRKAAAAKKAGGKKAKKGAEEEKELEYLIFGKSGWMGGTLAKMCEEKGYSYKFAQSRLENRESVEAEIDELKPKYVINAAGVTGRPNVDWCEDHKQETLRTNIIGTMSLIDVCFMKNIHITNLATGCIFKYDDEHTIGGKKFTEEDNANFEGSFYSLTKGLLERMLRFYPNLLNLRVRMPISDDLSERNFITKIVKYERVVNIPNSMTILHDLLPVVLEAPRRNLTGIYNFTNPGAISHNEILDLYKQYIDPDFYYINFSEEEQNKILKAARSNNELDSSKLLAHFPEIPHVKDGIKGVFERMKVNLDRDGTPLPKKPVRA